MFFFSKAFLKNFIYTRIAFIIFLPTFNCASIFEKKFHFLGIDVKQAPQTHTMPSPCLLMAFPYFLRAFRKANDEERIIPSDTRLRDAQQAR